MMVLTVDEWTVACPQACCCWLTKKHHLLPARRTEKKESEQSHVPKAAWEITLWFSHLKTEPVSLCGKKEKKVFLFVQSRWGDLTVQRGRLRPVCVGQGEGGGGGGGAIQLTQPRAEVQSHFCQHGCDVDQRPSGSNGQQDEWRETCSSRSAQKTDRGLRSS